MRLIKHWISLLCILGGLSLQAQSDFQRKEVETSRLIDGNSKAVWRLISDFRNLDQLAPNVIKEMAVTGKGVNSKWVITTADGAEITEEMIAFDSRKMTFSYRMTETPMPLRNYVAHFKVSEASDAQCSVTFTATFEALPKDVLELTQAFESFQSSYFENLQKLL